MKTKFANVDSVTRKWHLVDADGLILGRMASKIASILRGKHKAIYTPHMDAGDFVVIVNAEKVKVTGAKEINKLYWRHTQYPGGERSTTLERTREQFPERILEHAIKGMLPKGPLGRQMFKKLKVYTGTDHPHAAQQPTSLAL